jgi:predicted O-linked N-acetylglucosamine transferase (SPINDLY family)
MSVPAPLLQEGIALHGAGRLAEAIARFDQYTATRPNDALGWQHLALAAQQGGDLARAWRAASRAIELNGNSPPLYLLAGNIRQDQGDLEGAVKQFERAVRLDPKFAQAHNNLGIVLQLLGRPEPAAAAFRAAVEANPDYMRAWNNLGSTLLSLERPQEAVECLRRALAIDPSYAHAHLNLGLHELASGRHAEAEVTLKRAVELEPRLSDAHFGLGRLYRERFDLDRAEQSLRQAVQLNPRAADALLALGETLAEKGQRAAAAECYRLALAARPKSVRARMGLALTLPQVYASAQEVDALRQQYDAGLAALEQGIAGWLGDLHPGERITTAQWNNFYLAYQGRDDRPLQERFARFQRAILESVMAPLYQPIAKKPRAGRRLRVGFVSSFFYHCTAGNYFKSWVTKLDPARFETHVFSLHLNPDAVTQEIRQAATNFQQGAWSFAALAQAVRGADLDVLVYPELGMHARVFTLASLRLAPLQCAGWGHPVTSGHANIDVGFSSAVMEPEGAEAHYRERLVRLPGIGTCYPRPAIPEPVPRAALGLPEDAIAYLFPQSLFKVHPDNDAILVEILAREPKAIVVMFQSRHAPITNQFVDRLSRCFAAKGLPTAGRIKLLPNVPHADYLRVNLACDVMLDSLYWSGGNTSLDALACGLPVITRPGDFMRGRQSAGMLSLLGLPELVVDSNEAYVETALRAGRDRAWRDGLRARIAAESHRLFDEEEPVRALGDFLLGEFPE